MKKAILSSIVLDRHPFLQRLSQHVELAADDIAKLESIIEREISVRRKHELVVAGSEYRKLCFVKDGNAVRYQMLRNGKRHILDVILPGDVIGVPNSFYERAAYPVIAVNSLTISVCRLDDYLELCYQRPQFAFALCWLALQEATTHAERVIGHSRRTPVEQLSHFILEVHARLRSVGLAKGETFALPFSQEIIADLLGLSTPHLNRVMQQLKSQELVAGGNGQLKILDRETLKSIAHYDPPELLPIPLAKAGLPSKQVAIL